LPLRVRELNCLASNLPDEYHTAGSPMTFPPEITRAWVDVDLAAVVGNARTVATISGSRLLPMVKANGYGLGAVEIARALERADPWGFGVASIEEAASLRDSGIRRPILVLTPLIPEWIDQCLMLDLRPSLGDGAALERWLARGSKPFHIEIDTGMSRAGVRWNDHATLTRVATLLENAPGWEGAFTHFVAAESDTPATRRQWERFQDALRVFPRRPPMIHAANSAASLHGKVFAGDLVRPGIFLYGGGAGGLAPRPVAALRARVVALRSLGAGDSVGYGSTWRADRPVTVATICLGYADGLPRGAPAVGRERHQRAVELNGKLAPVVGRVTMDMCMVSVDRGVVVGDVATAFGGLISLDDQAHAAGTISYELLTRLGSRVARRYQG
jgi:alanine racemase